MASPLYKWTDAEGNVHYGQFAPPEHLPAEDLNERSVLQMTPTVEGPALVCGPIRLDTHSIENDDARRRLRGQIAAWREEARRLEGDPAEQRYSAALRCAADWGEEQLGGEYAVRAESAQDYYALQRRLEEATARLEACADGYDSVVIGPEAAEVSRCIRQHDGEVRTLRQRLQKHDYLRENR